jgi:Peptidase M50B-like
MSDADQLARLTGVPGGVWVGVFAVVAVVAIVVRARLLVPPTVHVPTIR